MILAGVAVSLLGDHYIAQHLQIADVNNEWIVGWPALGFVYAIHSLAPRGIRPESVDCLSREGDRNATFSQ